MVGALALRARAAERAAERAAVLDEERDAHRALRCAGAGVLFLLGALTGLAFAVLAGTAPR